MILCGSRTTGLHPDHHTESDDHPGEVASLDEQRSDATIRWDRRGRLVVVGVIAILTRCLNGVEDCSQVVDGEAVDELQLRVREATIGYTGTEHQHQVIGEHSNGVGIHTGIERCTVYDDRIVLLTELREQFSHRRRREQLWTAMIAASGRDESQAAFDLAQDLVQGDVAGEKIREARSRLYRERGVQMTAPHVAIDEQRSMPSLGEGHREIRGDERLAFAARWTADGKHSTQARIAGLPMMEREPNGAERFRHLPGFLAVTLARAPHAQRRDHAEDVQAEIVGRLLRIPEARV